jgi:hypothetical protein
VADRAMPLAAKVQNLLIADFLNYLALRHQIFLSTMDAASKKKGSSVKCVDAYREEHIALA